MMSDPSWLLDLYPASFRGVSFKVRGHSRTGGKRGADHEYPQRDLPSPEDLGRTANRFELEAFVIGDDYHDQAQRLITALEAGAGELIHPRWGSIRVICRSYTETETLADQGLASFALQFIEDPGLTGLTVLVSAEDAVGTAATATKAAAREHFLDRFTVAGLPGTVSDRALVDLADRVEAIRRAIASPIAGAVDDLDAVAGGLDAIALNALTLIQSPASLVDALIAVVEGIGNLGALRALTADRPASLTYGVVPPSNPSEAQIANNADGLVDVVQRVALVELGAAAVGSTFGIYDDAIALRDVIDDRIRVEEGLVVTLAEFSGLVDTRTATFEDLTERAASLARLRTITVNTTTTALALAWSLYGDAERAAEIMTRNGIVHGGFVAPGEYQVLSE
jgi:prophage DNA circulation protein